MRPASLNHAYRLVWSDVSQAYVAVAEHTKSHGKRSALSIAIALALAPALSSAQLINFDAPPIVKTGNENYTLSGNDPLSLYEDGTVYTIDVSPQDSPFGYTGTFTNNGIVEIKSQYGVDANRYTHGVLVTTDVGGKVVNNDTINSEITVSGTVMVGDSEDSYEASPSVYATGAEMGSISVSGTLTNVGFITAVAEKLDGNGIAQASAVKMGALGGALKNSGTISSNAKNHADGMAKALGVEIVGGIELSGRFTNTGNIEANAYSNFEDAYADSSAIGTSISGDIIGSFINAGGIFADAQTLNGRADAYGISIDGSIKAGGTFSNTLMISADASSLQNTARATGVRIAGDMAGLFSNAGSIAADTEAAYDGNVYGVFIGGGLSGTLNNNGTISAALNLNSGSETAEAHGIHSFGSLEGILKNSGAILATASADNNQVEAVGIYIDKNVSGTLRNASGGSIKVTASGDQAAAAGIVVMGDVEGAVINELGGFITATANGGEDPMSVAVAAGIAVYGTEVLNSLDSAEVSINTMPLGSITNNGRITVKANDTLVLQEGEVYNAQAHGIVTSGMVNANIANSGTIAVSAKAAGESYSIFNNSNVNNESGVANGIYISGNLAGGISNTGTISASMTLTEGADGHAAGIYVENEASVAGSISNTNEITAKATASNGSMGVAMGVFSEGNLGGGLTNSKTVSATATGDFTNPLNNQLGNVSTLPTDQTGNGAVAAGVALANAGGTLSNTGSIKAKATGDMAYAFGAAVGVTGFGMGGPGPSMNATSVQPALSSGPSTIVANSSTGVISASAEGYMAMAQGLVVDTVGSSQKVVNDGSISSSAIGGHDGVGMYGVAGGVMIGQLDGSLVNNGSIAASGTAAGGYGQGAASVSGIMVSDFDGGRINNSGTVVAKASTSGGAMAMAVGAMAQGYGGSFTNSNAISATASGEFTNPSNPVNNMNSMGSFSIAAGVALGGAGTSLSNTGSIKANATGDMAMSVGAMVGGNGFGMGGMGPYVNSSSVQPLGAISGPSTIVANSSTGAINASAEGYMATAQGLAVGEVGGNQKVINEGSINASAVSGHNGFGMYAVASGVSIGQLAGNLENSGTIGAFGIANVDNGQGAASVSGILVNSFDGGSINNSGTVIASYAAGYGTGNSIDSYDQEGTGTINNKSTGRLIGGINVMSSGVTVNNDGQLILKNGVDINDVKNTGTATQGHIAGNYNQGTTGVLQIAAASNKEGGYSQLAVGGTANIKGTAFVDVKKGNTLAVGQTLSSVVSSGNLVGNFAGVSDNSAMFNFNSQVNGNNIDLVTVRGTSATDAVNEKHNTPGAGAASVVDRLVYGDPAAVPAGLQKFVSEFSKLETTEELSNAVSQLLPLMTGGTSQSISAAVSGASRIVQARQEGQVGRSSGDGFIGDKKLWVKPFGSWADQNERNGVAGYNSDTYGMVFGLDAELSDINRVGLAFSYAKTDVDGEGVARQSADVDSYQLIAYGSRSLNDTTDVSFQAGWGTHANKGNRNLAVGSLTGTATSDYDSWSANLGVGIAHTIRLNEATNFTPSARLDYTIIHSDTYDEKGRGDLAGVALEGVKSRDTEALVVGLDGKLVHSINDRASVSANLGVGYDLINDSASTTAALAGDPTAIFTTRGLNPSPWLTRGGLGVTGKVTDMVEVTARYDFEVREDFNNQTVSVKMRWSF